MSSHFFTHSPQNFGVETGIHSLASWDKFFMQIPLMSKKMMIMLFRLLFTRLAFFSLGDVGLFHCEDCHFVSGSKPKTQLFSPVMTLEKNTSSSVAGDELTKISADADALVRLVSCQDPGHKFGCDTLHDQFFRQNAFACP